VSPRFALATNDNAQTWLDKAARGEPVTAGERNAFVWQAGAVMDALADPARIIKPTGPEVPTTTYNGPVREWNGRRVPLVGSVQAPPAWFGKARDTSSKGPREAGAITLADVLSPNDDERRLLWLATANIMRSLQVEGTVVSRERRPSGNVDAGLAPAVIAAIVVGVVGVVSWGLYLYEQHEVVRLRETEETARQARELQAAQASWLQRVQAQMQNPTRPMPAPSPAETRVTQRPYPAAPPPPAQNGADDFVEGIKRAAGQLLLWGGLGLVVVTAGPPVVANIADRATRPRAGSV